MCGLGDCVFFGQTTLCGNVRVSFEKIQGQPWKGKNVTKMQVELFVHFFARSEFLGTCTV